MSETATLPQDLAIENASGTVPAPSQTAASTVGTTEHSIVSASMLALPAEAHMLLEMIGRGLAPEADAATRDAARELWARFTQMLATAVPTMPTGPTMPSVPAIPTGPTMPTVPLPTSPIAMATRMLRQLPPDQLLDLALQRLRSALPAGATVPTPKGIQFQLVPVTSPPGSR